MTKRKETTWTMREIRKAFAAASLFRHGGYPLFQAELRRIARSRKPKKRGMKK